MAAILSQLDVLLSFADLSVNAPMPYARPTMTPSTRGDIVLRGSRHPCVEVQDDVSFIANDCKLVRFSIGPSSVDGCFGMPGFGNSPFAKGRFVFRFS